MNAKGIEGIVIFEIGLHGSHHDEADDRCDNSDGESAKQIDRSGSRRDGNKSGNGTRTRANGCGFLVKTPIDRHPGHRSCCRSHMGHKERVGIKTIGCQSATGVEAKPSEPKERGAKKHEHDVMRCDGMTHTIIFALADHQSHDEGRHASVDVYNGAASKVDGSHLLQEAAAPHPVGHGQIGDDNPQQGEHHVAFKLNALCEGAEDKSRCDKSKHALEHYERQFGNACRHQRVGCHAMKECFSPTTNNEEQWRS